MTRRCLSLSKQCIFTAIKMTRVLVLHEFQNDENTQMIFELTIVHRDRQKGNLAPSKKDSLFSHAEMGVNEKFTKFLAKSK
jgi:hypothetical protein